MPKTKFFDNVHGGEEYYVALGSEEVGNLPRQQSHSDFSPLDSRVPKRSLEHDDIDIADSHILNSIGTDGRSRCGSIERDATGN